MSDRIPSPAADRPNNEEPDLRERLEEIERTLARCEAAAARIEATR